MKTLSFFALSVAFILGACSPFRIARSEGEQPAPIIATQSVVTGEPATVSTDIFPTFGYQPVRVVDVYVEVGEGSVQNAFGSKNNNSEFFFKSL